jgi:hypothetical protein
VNVTERIIVTLIHGTFAPKANWVEEGSKLRKAVHDAFPGRVEFRKLAWSGGNTIDARRDAAGRLRAQILADSVPVTDARHFLIAHSHGGNIALYALRDSTVRERVTGVATLATPFLIARKRDLGTRGLIVFCVGFLGWSWLVGELVRRFAWPSAELLPPVIGTGLFILLSAVTIRLEQRAGKVAEDLQLAAPASGRLWIARVSGDEATAGLQTGQFAATIVAQIQLFFVRTNEWAERVAASSWRVSMGRVAGGLAVVALFWAIGRLIGVDGRSAPVLWSFLIAIGIGIAVVLWGLLPQAPRLVVPYAAGLLAPLALALAILLVLPLGPSLALYSFLLEMSAEATPLGAWTVHQYEPVLNDTSVGREVAPALTHSWVYDQSDVLQGLTTWMKECDRMG